MYVEKIRKKLSNIHIRQIGVKPLYIRHVQDFNAEITSSLIIAYCFLLSLSFRLVLVLVH